MCLANDNIESLNRELEYFQGLYVKEYIAGTRKDELLKDIIKNLKEMIKNETAEYNRFKAISRSN